MEEPLYTYVDEDSIDEELLCLHICQSPLLDPVVHNKCENMYCRECIKKVNYKCPVCGTGNKKSFAEVNIPTVLNLLAKIHVKCNRCAKVMKRGDFEAHKRKCHFDTITTTNLQFDSTTTGTGIGGTVNNSFSSFGGFGGYGASTNNLLGSSMMSTLFGASTTNLFGSTMMTTGFGNTPMFPPYKPTEELFQNQRVLFYSISKIKDYETMSFEEIRLAQSQAINEQGKGNFGTKKTATQPSALGFGETTTEPLSFGAPMSLFSTANRFGGDFSRGFGFDTETSTKTTGGFGTGNAAFGTQPTTSTSNPFGKSTSFASSFGNTASTGCTTGRFGFGPNTGTSGTGSSFTFGIKDTQSTSFSSFNFGSTSTTVPTTFSFGSTTTTIPSSGGFGFGFGGVTTNTGENTDTTGSPTYMGIKSNDRIVFGPKKFSDYDFCDKYILQGLNGMGFEQPSKIQEEVLKIIIDRSKRVNLIAQSQSGSGKTLCFVLAMLSSVDYNLASIQAICIAPTLELSEEIAQVAQGIVKHNPLLYVLFCPSEGVRYLPHTPHIIISIPKVINALIKKKIINTNTVKLFAVDEAHILLEEGNRNLKRNVQNIRNLLDRDCQYMLFTTTFEDDDITDLPHDEHVFGNKNKKVKVEEFCKKLIKDSPWPCHTILAPKEELTLTTMTQCMVKCNDEKEKHKLVASICRSTLADSSRQIIIFANRTDTVEQLPTILKKLGVHIGISIITASMEPQERRTFFNLFQFGEHRVLITTNYISRGIDVANVACVINYDLPMKNSHMPVTATYLHRIGRTARFGRKGCAINFSGSIGDTAIVKELAKHFNIKIPNVSPRELISFIEKNLKNNFTMGRKII